MKMKQSLITAGLAIAAIAIVTALSSCAELAGTTVGFGENGDITVTPPPRPIVIPTK